MEYYEAWKKTGLRLPQKPEDLQNQGEAVELEENGEYLIDGGLKQVTMGLGWDANCDVDASAALFDRDVKIVDQVWWKKLASECGAVVHSGDSRDGKEDEDDEVITVKLDELPLSVHYILFTVCVFTSDKDFSEVQRASVRVLHGKAKDKLLLRYDLTRLSGNAMLLGVLRRQGAYWRFTALGQPSSGRTIKDIVEEQSNLKALYTFSTFPPAVRNVSLTVLEGRDLAVKDKALFQKPSSDPFFKIKYKEVNFVSSHIKKSLNPKWGEDPVHLGQFVETSPKAVKITIWDYDLMSESDFMGTLWIPAAALFNLGLGTHEVWFPLTESKEEKYADAVVSGEILVQAIVSQFDWDQMQ